MLEVFGPSHDTTNFGGGGHQSISGASTKHVVADPGTETIDWPTLRTLCDKSVRGMEHGLPQEERVAWDSLERESGVCPNCQRVAAGQS